MSNNWHVRKSGEEEEGEEEEGEEEGDKDEHRMVRGRRSNKRLFVHHLQPTTSLVICTNATRAVSAAATAAAAAVVHSVV